ncbi:MAG: hypothetical protein AAGU75_17410 [Bacillota bacterium]
MSVADLLENMTDQNQQDMLWTIGLNLHQYPQFERLFFLDFLQRQRENMSPRLMFRGLGYLLHVYFSCMTDLEKTTYIEILLSLEPDTAPLRADIIEVIGIIFKVAPDNIKSLLIDKIFQDIHDPIDDPSIIISACNAFRFIFLEVNKNIRRKILSSLEEMQNLVYLGFLEDSLVSTMENLKSLEN